MAVELGVLVRRRFPATPDAVFRALTDPEKLVQWFSPSADIGTQVLEHDLRVGGRYRFGFVFPDGSRNTVVGSFREIETPRRLVFTWTWEPPDPHAGVETLVAITIEARDQECELVVTHDRFPTHESRDRHDAGWTTTLDRLASLIAEENGT